MTKMYDNEIGKSRPITPDHKEQSEVRTKWFDNFETNLRKKNPDLMKEVKLKIIGSVLKGLASKESDIDIVIQSKSSDSLLIPRVRQAIAKLLREMKDSQEQIYDIEVQTVGNPLMFSPIAKFRRNET